ncbi:dihydroorotase [Anaerosporobacter mobilis DSM 15930]|uniref:Dihydroorotase n=1 Tax=Anaerosporobacter mobilis DSM 15930 TaxID=1120996 RepID=A0A1M7KQ38_9FIRM|nr:dihydroorotase [Anaerosporobacter mobilis]SHM67607.1 dihydroorotase [Anaerosporobacter mobilis DSM 15930]
MKTLIKNGYVIDPATDKEEICDILIVDNCIAQIGQKITKEADQIIDATDCYVMPGFIDLHVHLREPGFEYKETIESGALAAAHGGFTSICPMPNTNPVIDSKETVAYLNDKSKKEAVVNVLPVGAVTIGQTGKELADITGMAKEGIVAISEDGKSVMDTALYKKAMAIAKEEGIVVLAHCEDKSLVQGGVMNAGKKANELGMPGITNAVEDVIAARDILMAKETGVKLHLCHCSTKDSAWMVGKAKEQGLPVTAEVCPHHFALTDEDIVEDDANYKMNPPLRSKEDVQALKEALRDNIIDVIATDHAPHSEEEKKKSIKEAPFGIVGLETAFALTMTELVKTGYLTPRQLVEKMSYNPAKVLGINKGTLKEGAIADIVIANPNEEYTIDTKDFVSKGKNTPFQGKKVYGKILYTLVDGQVVYQA